MNRHQWIHSNIVFYSIFSTLVNTQLTLNFERVGKITTGVLHCCSRKNRMNDINQI